MSLLSSLTNKPKLKSANKKVASARTAEGKQAEHLFQSAYLDFAEIIGDNSFLAETLHHWGFALYNQALTKEDAQAAEQLFAQASDKFSFSLLANPESIKPAIDWGVTLMAQATKKQAAADDPLFDTAIEKFQIAEYLFSGSASYNLACIYAMRNDQEACQKALEESRDSSSLPDEEDIMHDADLSNAHNEAWFAAFIESLHAPEPEPEPEASKVSESSEAEAAPETTTETAAVDENAEDSSKEETEK